MERKLYLEMIPCSLEEFKRKYPSVDEYDSKYESMLARQIYLADVIIEAQREIKALDKKMKIINKGHYV